MPVRFLNSSVLIWPDQAKVDEAVRAWISAESIRHPKLQRLAYFGSYARGDWGVGSDLDLFAIVEDSPEPFDRRSLSWDLSQLPVPAELLIYTLTEWNQMIAARGLFSRTLQREAVWISPFSPGGLTECRKRRCFGSPQLFYIPNPSWQAVSNDAVAYELDAQ
jgi:predicted nucleotidyltransferase